MKNIRIIIELTKRDIEEQFAGSVLGSLWAVLWPFIDLLIYIIIFGQMMGGRLPGNSSMTSYGVYVAVGLIPWKCFSTCVLRSTSIFVDKKHIVTKVRFSLLSLLFYVNLSEIVKFFISCALLAIFFVATDYSVNVKWILFPVIFYLQQIFAFSLGVIAAVFTVFFRDMREIVGIMIQFWFWFTPIVYIVEILPETILKIIVWNPAYTFVDSYHNLFVFNQYPDWNFLVPLALLVHGFLIFSIWILKVFEKEIRDFL